MFLMRCFVTRSLTEAETQLSFLRQNYGKAVEKLEDENQQLKSQVGENVAATRKNQIRRMQNLVIHASLSALDKRRCGIALVEYHVFSQMR